MALTNDESRRLTELAGQLNTEDPTLARLLTVLGPPPATRGRHRVLLFGSLTLMLALLLTVVGVVTTVPLVLGGGLAVFAFGVVGVTAGWWTTRNR